MLTVLLFYDGLQRQFVKDLPIAYDTLTLRATLTSTVETEIEASQTRLTGF
ncbi:hypothetical protein ACS8FD_03960 [Psychrobacter sp. 1U2]|uniref:hypothetical protein n=1 Tax=Psychrobacter sp. 1U2 TaxID=3453577 RepID=UPI003F455403